MTRKQKNTLIFIGAGCFVGGALDGFLRRGCINNNAERPIVFPTKSSLEEKFDNEHADWQNRRIQLGLELIQPYVSEDCEMLPTYSVGNPGIIHFLTIAELIGDYESALCPPVDWIYEQMSKSERTELQDISWGTGEYSLGNYHPQ